MRCFAQPVYTDDEKYAGLEVDVPVVGPHLKEKVVLSWAWVEACIQAKRVLGSEDDWGGHRIRYVPFCHLLSGNHDPLGVRC